MASVAVEKLNPAEKEQLAVSYAAFVLAGQGADITPESLEAVLEAAQIEASPALIKAFAKTLQDKNINEFYGAIGGGAEPEIAQAAEPVK